MEISTDNVDFTSVVIVHDPVGDKLLYGLETAFSSAVGYESFTLKENKNGTKSEIISPKTN